MTLEEKSIARSYWTYCYPLNWHELAHYLLGVNVPPDASKAEQKEVKKLLEQIPLLEKYETFNLLPGLVRQILNDIVYARDFSVQV